MPNPLLSTLRHRNRQLERSIADFDDLLVRVNALGQRTAPDHPRFIMLMDLYIQLSDIVTALKNARRALIRQMELLSRV